MHRIPGFGAALRASAALILSGCGGGAAASMKAEAAMAPPMPAPLPAATAAAPPMDRAPVSVPGAPSEGTGVAVAPEMLDIEANATVQVAKLKPALRALREATTRAGGTVTEERVEGASAQVTLRVPSRAATSVFRELDELGKVTDQSVTSRDIGKEYFDANLRLSNLQATQARYEQILSQATKVEDLLRIEQEMARLRGEIEQIKGDLRWLKDRAARATLHVALRERAPEVAYTPEPEAKFYPGVRAGMLFDFGKRDDRAYLGGGLSLRLNRAVSVDLDLYEPSTSEVRGPDALLATLGGEAYSDLLGGGERRFLNPYLGWRIGYARFASHDQALLGASAGVELVKTSWFGLDAEARGYAAFLGELGLHFALTPAITAKVAF